MLAASRIESTELVVVGLADFAVIHESPMLLRTQALGACLGISFFDPATRVAGLLHSMLPDSRIDPVRAAKRPGMFLDTGLAAMLRRARQLGASEQNLVICVAGGARILDESSHFNLGGRNYEVLTSLLQSHGLKILTQEVGGLSNRSLQLDTATGEVRLRVSGDPNPRTLCKPSINT